LVKEVLYLEDYVTALERRSISLIREAKAQFKNLGCLWSTGKDSTTAVWLCKKAFFGKVPFPVIHIDTGYKFPEIYEFRDAIAKEWGLDLVIAQNKESLKNGMSPKKGKLDCCTQLKTEALKDLIKERKFDALILAIRRDEHGIRAKERYFSPRDEEFKWQYTDQPAEMWDLYVKPSEDFSHMRVHPILHWTELDVWEYVKREKLPINPLYYAKDGKRYRSLGCMPCTVPIQSTASTIDEIVEELKTTKIPERAGRAQDKERAYMMQKLRSLGYM
jgi:sulfate adenylyltransferase subunit 2